MRLLVAASLLLFPACAIHAPMSETVMFRPTPVVASADSVQRVPRRVGFGLLVNLALAEHSAYLRAAGYMPDPDPNFQGDEAEVVNPGKGGAGLYLTFHNNARRRATNLALGLPMAGIDLTVPLSQRTYLTLGASLFGGFQGIVQRPLRQYRTGGLAVGLMARVIPQYYIPPERVLPGEPEDPEPGSYGLIPEMERRWDFDLGPRLVLQSRTAQWQGLHGFVYVGYAPLVQQAVLTFGFGFGNL